MALVRVTNVDVLNNPAHFLDPMQFEITFEASMDLPEDTEWKIIYVGSAESESYDQELDSVLVGPVPQGSLKFVFQVNPPDASKIPKNELLGVTVVLITGSYKSQEFIRIGYYVNIEFDDPALLESEEAPVDLDPRRLNRNILSSNPRVTRFNIKWDEALEEAASAALAGAGQRPDDDDEGGMTLEEMGAMDEDDDEDEDDDDGMADDGTYDLA